MRLIDADTENSKLLDFIAEHDVGIKYALEHKDMTILEDIFFEYFEAQKTAYDVDKVVEQLEIEAKRWQESGEEYKDQEELGVAKGYRLAIKIVKAGGVND